METGKWLGSRAALALAMAMAGGAHAAGGQGGEAAHAYIAPYGGYTHLRIDEGTVYQQTESYKFDALLLGMSFGFEWPVGFLVEVGRAHSIHADFFDDPGDFALTHTSGAVGWSIPFADTWHFTPKIGRLKWELSSDNRVLLDDQGERHYDINGWDNFYELNLTKELGRSVRMGAMFRDVDEDFGHSRSGAFYVSFAF